MLSAWANNCCTRNPQATFLKPSFDIDIYIEYTNNNKQHFIKVLNILITGSTGFVGSHMVKHIMQHGLKHPTFPEEYPSIPPRDLKVYAQGRDMKKAKELNLVDCADLTADQLEFIQIDLGATASETIVDILLSLRIGLIINCAAKCHYWGYRSDFESANIRSVENLLRYCKVAFRTRGRRVKLIHVGSSTVYATSRDLYDLKEDDFDANWKHRNQWKSEPVSLYAETKRRADDLLLYPSAAQEYVDFLVLRPRAIYGPGDNVILPTLIEKLSKRRVPIYYPSRSRRRGIAISPFARRRFR